MYLLTLALLVTSAAAAADLFRRWDYSAMESHPLQKREIVYCAAPVNGDASCASTCGPGYARCLSTNPILCYSESNGESCCGNGSSLTYLLLTPLSLSLSLYIWVRGLIDD